MQIKDLEISKLRQRARWLNADRIAHKTKYTGDTTKLRKANAELRADIFDKTTELNHAKKLLSDQRSRHTTVVNRQVRILHNSLTLTKRELSVAINIRDLAIEELVEVDEKCLDLWRKHKCLLEEQAGPSFAHSLALIHDLPASP